MLCRQHSFHLFSAKYLRNKMKTKCNIIKWSVTLPAQNALLIRILCIFSFSTADRKCLWLFTPAPSRRRCSRAYPIEASNWMWIYCSPIRTPTILRRERKIFVNSILMHRIRVSNERKIRVTAEGGGKGEGGGNGNCRAQQ